MRAVDLIRRKRDGHALDTRAIEFFVSGVTSGSIPDYQAAALLMAIYFRGMSEEETVALTTAMVQSGGRVTYPDLPGVPVDKHSTGGVGDKTSLILAPLVAACGAPVPMMSGRGLGHTGGTLDKLEAIPGFRTSLSLSELRRALTTVGCAMIGQTAEIAPADRKLYALRDVTGTVESIPLICASIMSKKIAEGIGGLVLDVKVGDGAFMKTLDDSRRLAKALVAIGKSAGVRTEACVTRMDHPLGRMVGNANETIECLEVLKGKGPDDVRQLSLALAGRMLVVGGIASDAAAGEEHARRALESGAALEKFRHIVRNQGGDTGAIDDYSRLPLAPDRHDVPSPASGYVSDLRAEAIGRAAVALGAGRSRLDEAIDYGVGIEIHAPVGAQVRAGAPVLTLHHRGGRGLTEALESIEGSVAVTETPPAVAPLIVESIV